MLFVEGLIHGAKFKNMYKSGKRICTKQHNPVQEEKRGEEEQNCNDYKFLFVFYCTIQILFLHCERFQKESLILRLKNEITNRKNVAYYEKVTDIFCRIDIEKSVYR